MVIRKRKEFYLSSVIVPSFLKLSLMKSTSNLKTWGHGYCNRITHVKKSHAKKEILSLLIFILFYKLFRWKILTECLNDFLGQFCYKKCLKTRWSSHLSRPNMYSDSILSGWPMIKLVYHQIGRMREGRFGSRVDWRDIIHLPLRQHKVITLNVCRLVTNQQITFHPRPLEKRERKRKIQGVSCQTRYMKTMAFCF